MAISATSLFFCDGVSENPNTRNVTVSGIFTTIRVDRLPSAETSVVVCALLRGQPEEEGHLRLTMAEPQGSNGAELLNGDVIIGRNGLRNIAIRLPPLTFQAAGPHTFTLYNGAVAIGMSILSIQH